MDLPETLRIEGFKQTEVLDSLQQYINEGKSEHTVTLLNPDTIKVPGRQYWTDVVSDDEIELHFKDYLFDNVKYKSIW